MSLFKSYIKDESAVSESIQQMLFIVLAIVAVGVVAAMIFGALSNAKEAVGEDFIQGG